MARHGVNILFAHVLDRAVPYATASVNLVGSATIGLLAASDRHRAPPMVHRAPHVRVRRHPRRLHDVFQLHARHASRSDTVANTRSRSGTWRCRSPSVSARCGAATASVSLSPERSVYASLARSARRRVGNRDVVSGDRRNPEGEHQQVRARQRDGSAASRPRALQRGLLSGRLRLHPADVSAATAIRSTCWCSDRSRCIR